ncbi:excinuclease ABC subunit A [candidate division KSB3 bacterium]|uniref:UvrABC system protein A n=1 Tax=candidate division KSB3 bacterium TaxID=2044937 RepID=A0A2G6KAH8_9BACT|nr:MAG: excinuclease ABC subunit A [candidate division KSB3 bacterium]
METITVTGAKLHNLKNITVDIPRNQLVVITGVSGSGKSSLAFDTLYAEGQRRYVESLSAYARQFLERMDKPDVDSIQGICPAIAIEQKNRVRNARSTIGTTTEIHDHLRLLFARIGTMYCEQCSKPVRKDSIDTILEHLFAHKEGSKCMVVFPLAEKYAVEHQEWQLTDRNEELERLKELLIGKGFLRVLIGNDVIYLEDEQFHFHDEQDVFVIVDRLVFKEQNRQRIVDALETAYQEGNNRLAVVFFREAGELEIQRFSRIFECSQCGITYVEPEPKLFSFNNPYGACPECHGFGDKMTWDLDRIIPNWKKSIRDGGILPWTTPKSRGIIRQLERIAPDYGFTLDTPLEELSPQQLTLLVEGSNEFIGIYPFFDYLEEKKYKMHVRVFMSKFRGYTPCPLCKGSRLNSTANLVRIKGKTIHDISRMTIADARQFFETLELTKFEHAIVKKVLEEIRHRLQYLCNVGLGYLTLNRLSRTLSGGEMQRIHLATSLGTSLVNSLYVLDEPSIGLHPRDNARLIDILKALRDKGNTVLVVEHDADMIRQSDYVIDMGPKAGEHGGEIIFDGTIGQLLAPIAARDGGDPLAASLTGQYLRGHKSVPLPKTKRPNANTFLTLEGASEHNLKHINVQIPLERFVCVTGVSGSGKSTLVYDVLYKALQDERRPGSSYLRLSGQEHLNGVVMVDQSPIGRTPRSNPVTYMKVFDGVRKLFSETRLARERGYKPGAFSFNIAGGRCETCEGSGQIQIEMQFLADLYLTCETCHGTRYKRELLDVTYQNKTIHDVLQMTVDEAIRFFIDQRRIVNKLRMLQNVGLGYLRLGQPATTLSGGEAQRLKLAAHLADTRKKRILYLFDEPTTGLHFDDISTLLNCFYQLVDRGHSLVVIEHNLDVIKCADYLIDLGPEGGDKGGEIVAYGTPEEICLQKMSHTGTYLKSYLYG